MNKFDDLIKEAKTVYEPEADFVDKTMARIINRKSRRLFSVKIWVPALAGSLAVVALVMTTLPSMDMKNNNSAKVAADERTQKNPNSSTSSAPNVAGADNASLERALNELATVASGIDTDQAEVEAAFNDGSNQIELSVN